MYLKYLIPSVCLQLSQDLPAATISLSPHSYPHRALSVKLFLATPGRINFSSSTLPSVLQSLNHKNLSTSQHEAPSEGIREICFLFSQRTSFCGKTRNKYSQLSLMHSSHRFGTSFYLSSDIHKILQAVHRI